MRGLMMFLMFTLNAALAAETQCDWHGDLEGKEFSSRKEEEENGWRVATRREAVAYVLCGGRRRAVVDGVRITRTRYGYLAVKSSSRRVLLVRP